MKTVENLIFDKRFKDAEFDPNDYNDWAKENEWEAYTICLTIAKQLQQHLVMRPDPNCPNCKGSGGVQIGFEEYDTCPCVQGAGLRCTGA